jgi:hypothetical protein
LLARDEPDAVEVPLPTPPAAVAAAVDVSGELRAIRDSLALALTEDR